MQRWSNGVLSVAAVALSAVSAHALEVRSEADEVARVAALIDARVGERWQRTNTTPAPLADDAEFCRRVHLAIAGRIPHVAEVVDFLDDPSTNKRRELVDSLLNGNGYINNFTTYWRTVLLPEASTDARVRFLIPGFEDWLRLQLMSPDNRFDEIVSRLLTSPLGQGGRVLGPRVPGATPVAFFQAKEDRPENLAAATSRMFLGIRLDCAQCHPHPFDSWTQEQFWGYAAFFARIERSEEDNLFTRIRSSFERRELKIPGTEKVVRATFLTGVQPPHRAEQTAREALSEWIIADENPYFAKATVNRIWGYLFGVGIVDPVDDFSDSNPASHPELLAELAREFVEHDHDLKFLIRAITASRTYQLTSRLTDPSQNEPQAFARMMPQPLRSDQLLASLSVAVGGRLITREQLALGPQRDLLEVFASQSEAPAERAVSILQALALMNGRLIAQATDAARGDMLSAVLEAPWMDTPERIETIYLATLSRRPNPEERARIEAFLEEADGTENPRQAFGDVLWALLNTSEFLSNH